MARYAKAIAALLTALTAGLLGDELVSDPEVQSLLIAVITAALVWLVPNKQ